MTQSLLDRGGAERRDDGAEAVASALAETQRLGGSLARSGQIAGGEGVLGEAECGDGTPDRFVLGCEVQRAAGERVRLFVLAIRASHRRLDRTERSLQCRRSGCVGMGAQALLRLLQPPQTLYK